MNAEGMGANTLHFCSNTIIMIFNNAPVLVLTQTHSSSHESERCWGTIRRCEYCIWWVSPCCSSGVSCGCVQPGALSDWASIEGSSCTGCCVVDEADTDILWIVRQMSWLLISTLALSLYNIHMYGWLKRNWTKLANFTTHTSKHCFICLTVPPTEKEGTPFHPGSGIEWSRSCCSYLYERAAQSHFWWRQKRSLHQPPVLCCCAIPGCSRETVTPIYDDMLAYV